eukprot:CFRG7745T1
MLQIPPIGFGSGTTWFEGFVHNIDGTPIKEELVEQLEKAVDTGFRHLDLAEKYGNEREVGVALARLFAKGHKRQDLWITSKIFINMGDVEGSCKATIQRLGCDYLDLYLLHTPPEWSESSQTTLENVWNGMEKVLSDGLVRNIGVSNFDILHLTKLLSTCKVPPMCNQVEFHPYLQQVQLQEFCKEKNILIQAYAPLSTITRLPGGPVDAVVEELSKKYNQPVSALLLRYTQQKGMNVITTTRDEERLKLFLSSVESPTVPALLTLTAEDINKIDVAGLKWHRRTYWPNKYPSSDA